MKSAVFISYRREGGEGFAQMFSEKLKKRYRVFYDIESIGAGLFDQRILREIEQSDVLLLILSKGALDRCAQEGDWVRTEIAHALKLGKPIIPLFFRGFEFPAKLPADIEKVALYNGVDIRDMNYLESKLKQLHGMINEAAKITHTAKLATTPKPADTATNAASKQPAPLPVSCVPPKKQDHTALARKYYYLAQKKESARSKFIFFKAKRFCKYQSDYYYLLAAEHGHMKALKHLAEHGLVRYTNRVNYYKDGSLNYARDKFAEGLYHLQSFRLCEEDYQYRLYWNKTVDAFREAAMLGHVLSQILLGELYSGGRTPYVDIGIRAANWMSHKKVENRGTAAYWYEQAEKQGIDRISP